MSLYEALKAAGVPLDNHASDLYAKVTPESMRLVKELGRGKSITTFRNNLDGALWYDIPFAFEPWWIRRTGRA